MLLDAAKRAKTGAELKSIRSSCPARPKPRGFVTLAYCSRAWLALSV
jgi:hypothetical protein